MPYLAILVIVTPLYFLATFVAFSYATADLVNGRWAAMLVAFVQSTDRDVLNLLGSRSKFVWSGLAVIYVLLMAFTAAFSLFVVARRAGPYRRSVLCTLVGAAITFGVVIWFLEASQLAGCFANACGGGCPTSSTGAPFSLVPYMGGVFCRIYDPSFVSFFRIFIALSAPFHFAILMLFFAAQLSLLVGPRALAQWTAADLRTRVLEFLIILVLGSALLTHGEVLELTLWGWLVEIAGDWQHAAQLRNLQVGSALYWGMCNSALMLLVFVPIGVWLTIQARAVARMHNEGASIPTLETWERDHGVTLRGHAMWPQIVAVLAPLLTGALAFLFEKAVG